jgi:glutathione S-transferase
LHDRPNQNEDMTITLNGFALSNYYNKVKLVLLEKGIAFDEKVVASGLKDPAVLTATPLGKVPFITTEHGHLCESQVISEYLDAAHPGPALMPKDPWQAAKVRELCTYVDWHLEVVARELYPQAFFGGTVSEATQTRVRKTLTKNIAGFATLAKFSPFMAGENFTLADCCGYVSLPLVALSSRVVLGEDLLLTHGVDWKSYAKRIGERPSAQRVDADRRVDQDRFSRKA